LGSGEACAAYMKRPRAENIQEERDLEPLVSQSPGRLPPMEPASPRTVKRVLGGSSCVAIALACCLALVLIIRPTSSTQKRGPQTIRKDELTEPPITMSPVSSTIGLTTAPSPISTQSSQLSKVPSLEPSRGVNLIPTSFPTAFDPVRQCINETLVDLWDRMQELTFACESPSTCRCRDPTQPSITNKGWQGDWNRTATRNIQVINGHENLDVVFLGDSITEHMIGTEMARLYPRLADNLALFEENFRSSEPGSLRGEAMGLGGDKTENLLYRIENGELPLDLNVSVAWVTIGTNHLSDKCNRDTVVAGNLAIIHAILRRPNVKRVVINSLLPRSSRMDLSSLESEWADLHFTNAEMSCFTDLCGPAVEFFNATELFIVDSSHKNEDLYTDPVHVNAAGYKVWFEAIRRRMSAILEELAVEDTVSTKQQAMEAFKGIRFEADLPPVPKPPGTCSQDVLPQSFPKPHSRCEYAGCRCRDPLVPSQRLDHKKTQWAYATNRNQALIRSFDNFHLDVLFVGDSITERWLGTQMGTLGYTEQVAKSLNATREVFTDTFTDRGTSAYALGIAGDRIPYLLYRLENGELPSALNVSTIVLLIGTNDIGIDGCNVDSVTAGNIAVIDRLLQIPSVERVMINSLLPRGDKTITDRGWEMHKAVNHNLRCYADSHSGKILFFNATDLFMADASRRDDSLFDDGVHPSPLGYKVWGDAIFNELQKYA